MKEQAGRAANAGLFWFAASISALIPLAHGPALFGPFTFPKAWLLWIGAGIVLSLIGASVSSRGGLRSSTGYILWLPALFVVALTLLTFYSLDPSLSVWGARNRHMGLVTYAAAVILFYAVLLSATPARAWAWARLAVAGAAPLSLLALAQRAGLAYPIDFSRAVGERVGSTIGNPNFLGIYLAMILALALGLASDDDRRYRPAWYLISLLIVAGLIVTNSLGAWLAAAVTTLAWIVRATRGLPARQPAHALAATAVAAIGLGVFLVYETDVWFSVTDRMAVWTSGVRAYGLAPVTGHGLDTLRSVLASVQPVSLGSRVYGDAHNVFITLAASAGPLPLCIFLAVIYSWFTTKPDSRGRPGGPVLFFSLKSALAAYLIGHLFNPESITPFVMFWVIGAVLVGLAMPERGEPSRPTPRSLRLVGLTFAALGIVAVLGLGSVGWRIWQAERYIKLATREPDVRVALEHAAKAQAYWPRHPLYGYLLFDRAAPYLGQDTAITSAVESGLARAIAFSPRDADAFYIRGAFHSRLAGNDGSDHLEAALADWREALRFNPVKLLANYEIAKLYLAKGEAQKAAHHLELILRLTKENDERREEIEALLRQARD